MTKEALKLALEALEGVHRDPKGWWNFHVEITAIKEALAQPTSGDYALGYAEGFNDACKKPEQEPFGYYDSKDGLFSKPNFYHNEKELVKKGIIFALYATPPKEQQSCDKRNGGVLPMQEKMTWPFPTKLPVAPANGPVPKFNPDNYEDALL